MKYTRLMVIVAFVLALVSVLPAVAQGEISEIEFVFNGVELQKLEAGAVVQAWTMPNALETQQMVAVLNARVQADDPDVRYVFDDDRMYHLRGGQVVNLWQLRGGRWIEAPVLNVQYAYNGQQLQRFVNGAVQHAWTMPVGLETQQVMMVMQAEANMIVAEHMFQELYVDQTIEHLPALVADDFTLHYIPMDGAADMKWYKPEVAEAFTSVLAAPITGPVVLAAEDLVMTQHPTGTNLAELMGFPPIVDEETRVLYDLYRIEEGKVTDLWLGYDLPELLK